MKSGVTNDVKVSIIVSVYNVAGYLRCCLDTIVNQTLRDIEIICIDDCSTDESYEILQEYASRDQRIIISRNPRNLGAGTTRNIGTQIACGEYLAILDGDDYFELDMIESMYRKCKEDNADLCVSDYYLRNEIENSEKIMFPASDSFRKVKSRTFSVSDIPDDIFTTFLEVPFNKLYRRRFIQEESLEFQNLPNSNDVFFCTIVMAVAQRITYLHRPFVHYRTKRPGQITSNRKKFPLCGYQALMKLKTKLRDKRLDHLTRKSFHLLAVWVARSSINAVEKSKKDETVRFWKAKGFKSLGMEYCPRSEFKREDIYLEYLKLSGLKERPSKRITIGITTYNRHELLKNMAKSLYESELACDYSIRIYDDASQEFHEDELRKIFPDAKTIYIQEKNHGADFNTAYMYQDFMKTEDDFLFTADADLLFCKDWVKESMNLIKKTDGVMSILNAPSHPSIKEDEEFCEKEAIGSAGTWFTRERVRQICEAYSEFQPNSGIDWSWSSYFRKHGIRMLCTKKSLVQHVGAVGQWSKASCFDFGLGFSVDTLHNGQMINDLLERVSLTADIYYRRGRSYFRMQKYREAVSEFTKAIEGNKNLKEAYIGRGKAYEHLNEMDKATEDLHKGNDLGASSVTRPRQSILFPCHLFPRDSKVLIYGNALLGTFLFEEAKISGYVLPVGVVDEDKTKEVINGIKLWRVDDITKIEFDFILLAQDSKKKAEETAHSLEDRGIRKSIIKWSEPIRSKNDFYRSIYLPVLDLNHKMVPFFVHYKKNDDLVNNGTETKPSFPSHRATQLKDRKLAIAFYCNGGYGDCIIAKALVVKILEAVTSPFEAYLYGSPINMKFQEFLYGEEKIKVFDSQRPHPVHMIVRISYLIKVECSDWETLKILDEDFYRKMKKYAENVKAYGLSYGTPLHYGIHFARTRLTHKNCYTSLGYGVFDVNGSGALLPTVDGNLTKKFDLPKNYVTINCGYGNQAGKKVSPKAWPKEFFNLLIKLVKQNHKNLQLVQLGGKETSKLDGVDVYVLGEDWPICASVLKKSCLHVDIEGGLVHLAHHLNTKCVVLFGPTPVHYFGYENNINIVSNSCHDCCYLMNDWSTCVKRQSPPECMSSIEPEFVYETIKDELNKISQYCYE